MISAADTIYALSTASGKAAVAVVRVSGAVVPKVLNALLGEVPPPRHATLAALRHPTSTTVIDQALVLNFPAPNSATGEHMCEFHVHGGRAVVAAVLDAIATIASCRMAEPGEFAHRAFDNHKLDLTSIEGLADLIDAETEAQRRQAIHLATGNLARLYSEWRNQLINAQGLVEAAIDFADEGDVGDKAYSQAQEVVSTLRSKITNHCDGAHASEIIRDGYRVVIAGPPNAGKSSLLNALAQRDAAIVSPQPGTTRDVIDVHLDLGGLAIHLSDTAGMRDTGGPVEQEGMRRAQARAESAHLVIWLSPVDEPTLPPSTWARAQTQQIVLASKADLASSAPSNDATERLAISTKTGTGLDRLTEIILKHARTSVGDLTQAASTTARQRQHLATAQHHLVAFQSGDQEFLELRAEDLRLAAVSLGRLTGHIDVEDILDEIFSRFCIGK